MAHEILRDIAKLVSDSPFYCIVADETRDLSNKEQLVIVFRYLTSKCEVSEPFIRKYAIRWYSGIHLHIELLLYEIHYV